MIFHSFFMRTVSQSGNSYFMLKPSAGVPLLEVQFESISFDLADRPRFPVHRKDGYGTVI
jgi:hypothetical protein